MTHHRLAFRRDCRRAGLTDRETDVLVELSEGWTQPEAARNLGINLQTVKNHLAAARDRTGSASTLHLLAYVAWFEEAA